MRQCLTIYNAKLHEIGYLMRLAYELGYSNASVFTRGVLRFLSLDEITFKHPVPIGSVLRLKSRIAHTIPTVPSSVVISQYFYWLFQLTAPGST
jgi:acyl-CoA hydrolase